MQSADVIYEFLDQACEDHRVGPMHISLYLAIWYACRRQDFNMPVTIYGKELRRLSKIGGSGTYHRYLKDLWEFGFIFYESSCNPAAGSRIGLNFERK
jgi:hypothetical protein